MKNKTGSIIAIILLSLLALGLIFAMCFGIKNINMSELPKIHLGTSYSERLALDREFELEDVKNIKSESESADIKFIKSETETSKVQVKIYAEEDKDVSAKNEDHTLAISVKNQCKGFCINMHGTRVEITLPESYTGDFEINDDAGDIESDSFSYAAFNINSNAGDVKIAGAKSITITTNAGDIDILSAENISIDSNMGDIKISECFNKLHIKTSAGDIHINELQLSENSDIKTDAGDISINNAGNTYVDAHANFGDVKVQNNNRNASTELKIETNAGDIKVN